MAADPAKILKSEESLRTSAATHWQVCQTLADYIMPHKSNDIITIRTPGERQTERLFDSEAPDAAIILAASLGGLLTSSVQKWMSLVMRDQTLMKVKEVRDWLEDTTDRTLAAINQSNFVTEAAEFYLDLVTFGTGGLFIDEAMPTALGVWGGPSFKAMPMGSYVIAEDANGRVDTLYRRLRMGARAAVDKWAPGAKSKEEAAGTVGDKIAEMAFTERRAHEMVTIVHGVYPRGDDRKASSYTRQNMKFASCYVALDDKKLIREGGYQEQPFSVTRWSKSSSEVFGRGPGHTALPDIRSLNREVELYFAAAAKAIDPTAFATEDGVLGSISWEPGMVNVVKDQQSFWIMESKSRLEYAEHLFNRLERKIQQIFFTPFLRILREKPGMTATEIIAIKEETLRLMGPLAGRSHAEYLMPMVDRVVSMAARAGALSPVPEVLAQAPRGDIDVEYEGPLARAQKAADVEAIQRWYGLMAQIAAARGSGDIFDNADDDEAARLAGQIYGVPTTIIRGDAQVADVRSSRLAQQQAAQRMAAIQGTLETVGRAGPGLKALTEAGAMGKTGAPEDQTAMAGAA